MVRYRRSFGNRVTPVGIFTLLLLLGCNQSGESRAAYKMDGPSIVAPPGERPFDKEYGIDLRLPMPESEFVRILKQHGLDYEIIGERGTKKMIVSPRESSAIDPSKMIRQYQIYGGIDRKRRIGKMYWAYADQSGRIVYVENAYSYTGT